MRLAIPLLAALAMVTLVGCGGDDETATPVPLEQRFVTAEDAPGSKPDPDETRQTTVVFDEFITVLSEASVDPDTEEMTEVFQEAGFKGGRRCGHAFLRGDAHARQLAARRQLVHRARIG